MLQSVLVSKSRSKASLDQSNGTHIPLFPTSSSAVGIGEVVQQTRNTHSSNKHCHVISREYKEGNQEVCQEEGTLLGFNIKCKTHSCHMSCLLNLSLMGGGRKHFPRWKKSPVKARANIHFHIFALKTTEQCWESALLPP